jgi:methionine-rich copper-binding protein CopC
MIMKRILLICLALVWLLPQAALAHSKLTESMPEKDSTSEAAPQEIRLTYDTRIEKISNFKLFDANGAEVALGETLVEGDTMSNRPAAPLGNGDYTVKWTIVGADGHAIEGQYGFSVAAPEATATPEPTATAAPTAGEATDEPSATPEPTATEEASPSPSPSAPPESGESDNGDDNSGMSPLIAIGGIIVIVAVAAVLLRRRKP